MFEAFSKLFTQDERASAEAAANLMPLSKARKRPLSSTEQSACKSKTNCLQKHGPEANQQGYFMDPNWKKDPSNALSNLKTLSQKQGQERKFLRPLNRNGSISTSSAAQLSLVECKNDKAPAVDTERQKKAILDLLNINGDHHTFIAEGC